MAGLGKARGENGVSKKIKEQQIGQKSRDIHFFRHKVSAVWSSPSAWTLLNQDFLGKSKASLFPFLLFTEILRFILQWSCFWSCSCWELAMVSNIFKTDFKKVKEKYLFWELLQETFHQLNFSFLSMIINWLNFIYDWVWETISSGFLEIKVLDSPSLIQNSTPIAAHFF